MAAKKKAATKTKAAPKQREGTITSFVQPLIREGNLGIDALIAKVKGKFPESKFQKSHIYWHRQALVRQGETVPALIGGRVPKADGAAEGRQRRRAKANVAKPVKAKAKAKAKANGKAKKSDAVAKAPRKPRTPRPEAPGAEAAI